MIFWFESAAARQQPPKLGGLLPSEYPDMHQLSHRLKEVNQNGCKQGQLLLAKAYIGDEMFLQTLLY